MNDSEFSDFDFCKCFGSCDCPCVGPDECVCTDRCGCWHDESGDV